MNKGKRTGRAILLDLCGVFLLGLPPVTADDLRADLWAAVKNAIVAADKAADGGRCAVANAEAPKGTVFVASTPELRPGVYEAVLHMKISTNNSVNTSSLTWRMAVEGAGKGSRDFDIMVMERSGVYQDIPCPFTVVRQGRATVSLAWDRHGAPVRANAADLVAVEKQLAVPGVNRAEPGTDMELEAEPPIETLHYLHMAVDKLSIVPVSDVDVARLAVDKIRYRPANTARVEVVIRNYASAPRSLQVETDFVREMDDVVPVDRRAVRIDAGGEQTLDLRGPPFTDEWGYEVRCRVVENGKTVADKSEYFTVHSNMWAVAINGSRPAQFTARVTREKAVESAQGNKRAYRNWVESGFWAPDDFGDFTPDTEHWWGGQECYYGSIAGTRTMIEEGHKAGISYAVYAIIWGGDGPPAFELARVHPDWAFPCKFDVRVMDLWDRNPRGKTEGDEGWGAWPVALIRGGKVDEDRPQLEHHAHELVATHRMFGWDAVRYDSHGISEGTAGMMRIVKKAVWAEEPDFQFGYNSSVPDFPPDQSGPFREHCERGGLIMEEGIRDSWQGGTYEGLANRILVMKENARKYGGHFLAIGMDKAFANDSIYQNIFWLAGNTHNAYDSGIVSVGNYNQFATRFAGILWDLQTTSVTNARRWLDLGESERLLWKPDRYVHQRDLGGGRRQFIVHLINAPLEKFLYKHDDKKLPPPREKLRLAVNLPGQARVRGVWLLTPEPRLTQKKLETAIGDGKVAFTVPRLRFWDVVVADLENAEEFK